MSVDGDSPAGQEESEAAGAARADSPGGARFGSPRQPRTAHTLPRRPPPAARLVLGSSPAAARAPLRFFRSLRLPQSWVCKT